MKRIGTLNGKPVVQCDENLLKKNTILYKENNGKIELSEREDSGKIDNITQGNNSDNDSSSDNTIDLDTVITGFYLGTLELDSSYTYDVYTPKIDISEYIHKESNGVYNTDFQTLYNLKGNNNTLIITTNIDNLCFIQDWTGMLNTTNKNYWYLYPSRQYQQYDVTVDTLLPAIIISY